MFDLGLVDF